MLIINEYLIMQAILYIIAIGVLIGITKRNMSLSIKRYISRKEFIYKFILISSIGLAQLFFLILTEDISVEVDTGKIVIFVLYLVEIIFSVLLMSTWLRCFYSRFHNLVLGTVVIIVWAVNQIIAILSGFIPYILGFLICWIIVRKNEEQNKK